ncbi:EF-P lysine aminoacylase GenX [Roseococcus sp. SDR]|uniref:EF-P lysine aminoacylase EpmA n=1 Tax=Roseococcus sp. SDR TaxID=2835532 RepID=UPI001BCBBA92|nr:EF-P lysine aminoacylase EpmA [Roseococcus sp. SDR]MBS7788430.1 EF-P lysine aminoacylase GenX [Roseococcus sp. SDR]MBV1843744.1 EF-P lysine aminoacylase GenX [Roseococcus sp. SDR]
MPHPVWHPESLAARLPFLDARARITAATRAWLTERGYREVETPCLVPAPGMEVHLRGFQSQYEPHLGQGERRALWLRTSPELALKRLLVGGAGAVFELARVWRNGEIGTRHAPEFTMLEWYRPGLTLDGLMDETEALVRALCPPTVAHEGVTTDLSLPFERITCAEAFARHAGLDLLASIRPDGTGDGAALGARADESWEEAFFRILLDHVEPHLGRARASFLTHWPTPQAALARRDPKDPRVALRFELFAGGIELANAFDELTDAEEQATRFAHDVAERERLYGADASWPVDADFLAALRQGMPSGSGIALGFDRLAMLASGARRIGDVLWLGGYPYE